MNMRPLQTMIGAIVAASVAQASHAQVQERTGSIYNSFPTRQIDMPGNDTFQNAPGVSNCVPEHPTTNATRKNMEQAHPVGMGRLEAWAAKHSFNIPGTFLKCDYKGNLNAIPPTVTVLKAPNQ